MFAVYPLQGRSSSPLNRLHRGNDAARDSENGSQYFGVSGGPSSSSNGSTRGHSTVDGQVVREYRSPIYESGFGPNDDANALMKAYPNVVNYSAGGIGIGMGSSRSLGQSAVIQSPSGSNRGLIIPPLTAVAVHNEQVSYCDTFNINYLLKTSTDITCISSVHYHGLVLLFFSYYDSSFLPLSFIHYYINLVCV